MDGERVDPARELAGKGCVDHAVALEPALSFEGVSYDMDPEMGLPARPMPGMPHVLVGFVDHLQASRRESLGQLFDDQIAPGHGLTA